MRENYSMNFGSIPRTPGEAIGGLALLEKPDSDDAPMMCNVEYNQLEPLLKQCGMGGDVADASGMSPYPGRIRAIVLF